MTALFTNVMHYSLFNVKINVDRGQMYKTFTLPEELIKWRGPAFLKYLEENGNERREGYFRVFNLFDQRSDTFHWIVQTLLNNGIPYGLPSLRASKLNTLVGIYAAASRLKLDYVMNHVLDAFLADINADDSFPLTLVVEIYNQTVRGCGLQKWFLEQVTVSIDAEDFDGFTDYWPAEALVDLAKHCMGRFVPPMRLTEMTKFYQPPFPVST